MRNYGSIDLNYNTATFVMRDCNNVKFVTKGCITAVFVM